MLSTRVTNSLQTRWVRTEQIFKKFSSFFQTFQYLNQIFLQSFHRISTRTLFLDHFGLDFILDDRSNVFSRIEIWRISRPNIISPKFDSALFQQMLSRLGSHARGFIVKKTLNFGGNFEEKSD